MARVAASHGSGRGVEYARAAGQCEPAAGVRRAVQRRGGLLGRARGRSSAGGRRQRSTYPFSRRRAAEALLVRPPLLSRPTVTEARPEVGHVPFPASPPLFAPRFIPLSELFPCSRLLTSSGRARTSR